MDVGVEAALFRDGSHANRIVSRRPTRPARDPRAHHLGNPRNPGGDLAELFLRHGGAGHQFHHVAKTAGGQRFPQWIRGGHASCHYFPNSLRTMRVPSTIAFSLANATSRDKWNSPQSGRIKIRSGGNTVSALRIRSATISGV